MNAAGLRRALVDGHAFYRRHLRGSWVPGYLAERGLSAQLSPAGIGYAPIAWAACVEHLRGCGHDDATIIAAGLGRESSIGTLIDTLRDRLVVPVTDTNHDLVGFTARASKEADPETTPKWVNTATTDLFRKSELLYGLGEERGALERSALPVLVEGAMDRLAVREAAGHLGIVGLSALGTALTRHHVASLTDLIGTHRPVAVAFDPDTAGRKATLAAWDLLKAGRGPADGTLLHIDLPSGCDPAELVKLGRGEELRRRLMRPTPLANVVADLRINEAGDLSHVGKRVGLLRDLVVDVPHLHRSAVSGYLAHLGQRLDLDHHTVTREALLGISRPENSGSTGTATPT